MISFIDVDTKTEVYVNPDTVKIIRESRLGTRIQFIDGSFLIVVDGMKTCVGKLAKKAPK